MNDKKIDAELYAYLQSKSCIEDGRTVVHKWECGKQKTICDVIGVASTKTYKVHLNYLIDCGYVVDDGDDYVLPNMEDIYLLLPLKTIQYLEDVFKLSVIKIYVYLGQKWKNSTEREFTYEELAAHTGIKLKGNTRGYEQIRNSLKALVSTGCIKISEEYFIAYGKSRHRLLNWTSVIE